VEEGGGRWLARLGVESVRAGGAGMRKGKHPIQPESGREEACVSGAGGVDYFEGVKSFK